MHPHKEKHINKLICQIFNIHVQKTYFIIEWSSSFNGHALPELALDMEVYCNDTRLYFYNSCFITFKVLFVYSLEEPKFECFLFSCCM